ncbi:cupin domain-containing protein [Rathayibacter sp. CAU 1779]
MTKDLTNGIPAPDGTDGDPNEGVRNIDAALATFSEPWHPHRLVSINDYDVKVVKFHGEFIWHTHPETDELFVVRSGELTIQLRAGDVVLRPGDVYVVPAGVEHCPKADEETAVLLFEPQGTTNTGDQGGERTERLREL